MSRSMLFLLLLFLWWPSKLVRRIAFPYFPLKLEACKEQKAPSLGGGWGRRNKRRIYSDWPSSHPPTDFVGRQRQHANVRSAYHDKGTVVDQRLKRLGLTRQNLHVLLVAYKEEKELEVWAKGRQDSVYQWLHTYPVCHLSGHLGPKLTRGDRQTPEGLYHIDRFNPDSWFFLSFGIDFPSAVDRWASPTPHLWADIFIHGACITEGCLPMADDGIKELYILVIEAWNNGQQGPPVYIFPARLTTANLDRLTRRYAAQKPQLAAFWQNLKTGYDQFNAQHRELRYTTERGSGYVFR